MTRYCKVAKSPRPVTTAGGEGVLGRRKFIVIEGLIGVGKTSLCRILQRRWKARLILEPCDDNPFLAAFYADRERYAFPAQMFYLATRFAQQMELIQTDLFTNLIVSDYLYEKDRLFAEETLNPQELALYDRFATLLGANIPDPDFIVFLDSPTHVIQERIKRRAIRAEQTIPDEYLDSLRARYYSLWDRYPNSPIYVVDTSNIQYIDNVEDRNMMLAMIEGWLEGRPVPGAPEPYQCDTPRQLQLFG